MKLHVLTAVSRPENLPRIAESLAIASEKAPAVRLQWHWLFDLDREHVGGQALKNEMLDDIDDGWVWVLDDDTLAHEDVLAVVSERANYESRNDRAGAVIVGQFRTDGRVLVARPEHLVPGMVDIGQAFLRRDLIGDHRIPEDYNGDGMFLQAVLAEKGAWFVGQILSLHNALSGVDVSV